jgi:hypothetical protein
LIFKKEMDGLRIRQMQKIHLIFLEIERDI